MNDFCRRSFDIKVNCSKCKQMVDEQDTTFVNIEEDFEGHDVLTFVCPICGTTQKSKRYGR